MCKNGGTARGKLKKLLGYVSLGKYRTPLYYKNDDSYSTITTGLVSLIFIVGMIVYAVLVMVPIFEKDKYRMDRSS